MPVQGQREASGKIHAGDELLLKLKDGSQRELQVVSVEAAGIRGENTLVQWQQIQSIEKRRFSLGKTLGLTAGIWATVVVIYAAMLRAMFSQLDDDLNNRSSGA